MCQRHVTKDQRAGACVQVSLLQKPMFYCYTRGWEPAIRYSSPQGKGCSWHSCGQRAPKDLQNMGGKAGQGICNEPTVSAHCTSWDCRQRLGLGDSKESFGPQQGNLNLISFSGDPRALS